MAEIRKAMQRTMDALVGVFRTEESLNQACADLAELRARFQRVRLDDRSRVFNTELTAALELGFMLDVAEAIAHSALARRESRGAHARRDHPKRDDRHYLAHTLAYQDADAPPQLEYRPVTIKRWRPEARTY
jgi:succinate dehydrogenase/fumarate reductase flavoprotein subunit